MKAIARVLWIGLFGLLACGKGGDQTETSFEEREENTNQALYDEVMDVHDEVMPKMDEIMRLKRELKEKIAESPDLVLERQQKIEQVISNLDSAGTAMMNWMHEFNPLPDSVDQEAARAYLESEMERIKKVKEVMLESIEKAKEEKAN